MPKSLTPPTSSIRITYDGVDIQDFVLFNSCSFECQANAVPGTGHIVVKDQDQDKSFAVGKEVQLFIDDILMWGGIVMRVGRQLAFPVDDTTDISSVKTRQWVLECSDYNIWFDKRVVRNPDDYLSAIITEGVHKDGYMIRTLMPDYIDVPPDLDVTTHVMDIADFGERDNDGDFQIRYAWVTQGTPWRKQMDEFAARSAATYYISADKSLWFINLEDTTVPWVFCDYAPGGNWNGRVPTREVHAQEDGSLIVNDALVWGGLEADEAIYFSRYEDEVAENDVGRWQYAESNFQQGDTQDTVELRARYIVEGPPGTSGSVVSGLRYPLWRFTLTWFAHDIPRVAGEPQHIKPGNIVNIMLYTMGDGVAKPLIQMLPLRNMTVTFPQMKGANEVWVKFTGEFGISYSDSRYLWAYLINRGKLSTQQVLGSVDNASVGSKFGDFARLNPNEQPDGERTEFTFPFPLLRGSERVYVNGLYWREGHEYTIADDGTIVFNVPLATDDKLYVEARTGLG
jgi:hypothetical protein